MPRNGSGTFSLTTGNPVVTGTTISSTDHNNTLSDIATALTASIAKDGQTTPSANLPMGTYRHTGVGAGAALTDYARYDQLQNSSPQYLTSVSGADTITAAAPVAPSAYAAGQTFRFIAVSANTGAVTLNVSSLGAKAVKKNGTTALVAGDIPSGAVVEVVYDGTNFQLPSGLKAGDIGVTVQAYDANLRPLVAGTAVASTSGTSIDFTSIPSWVKRITVMFSGVSTNSTSAMPLIQIGDSGGVEATGYSTTGGYYGASSSITAYTNGWSLNFASAAALVDGMLILTNVSGQLWVGMGIFSSQGGTFLYSTSGTKALSATLDRVRITTTNGTDTFDAGTVNILYE